MSSWTPCPRCGKKHNHYIRKEDTEAWKKWENSPNLVNRPCCCNHSVRDCKTARTKAEKITKRGRVSETNQRIMTVSPQPNVTEQTDSASSAASALTSNIGSVAEVR